MPWHASQERTVTGRSGRWWTYFVYFVYFGLRLRLLATTLAQIERAELWLAEQPDPLFRDVRSGELWPLTERLDKWVAASTAMIDKLPAAAGHVLSDFEPLYSRRRTSRDL